MATLINYPWLPPERWIDGETITADKVNRQVLSNSLQTAVNKAAAAGDIFVGAGPNQIAKLALPTDPCHHVLTASSAAAYGARWNPYTIENIIDFPLTIKGDDRYTQQAACMVNPCGAVYRDFDLSILYQYVSSAYFKVLLGYGKGGSDTTPIDTAPVSGTIYVLLRYAASSGDPDPTSLTDFSSTLATLTKTYNDFSSSQYILGVTSDVSATIRGNFSVSEDLAISINSENLPDTDHHVQLIHASLCFTIDPDYV